MFRVLLACALSSAACIPHPGGQCDQPSDCGYGTTCQRGLCELPGPPTRADATWLAPEDGAWRAGGTIALSLIAQGTNVRVVAQSAAGPVVIPLERSEDGTFHGALDASALLDGDWTLSPEIDGLPGPSRVLHLDRTGPGITLNLPVAEGGAFLRNQTIVVSARIADRGVGLDARTPVITAEGMAPIAGHRFSALEWRFAVPLSLPLLFAAQGPIGLHVIAADLLGNQAKADGTVAVTRLLWSTAAGKGLPIRSTAAVDKAHVYIGTDQGSLVALDRATGVPIWSHALHGPISSSPARGQFVYGASEAGEVVALDPDTGDARWSCPGLSGTMQFLSSPAVAQAGSVGSVETVFLANASAIQQGNDTIQGGIVGASAAGCAAWGAFGGGRSSPALGGDKAIYLGGLDARMHSVRFDGSAFHESWSVAVSGVTSPDTSPSPALSASGAVLFGAEDGSLRWLSAAGTALGSGALGEKLLASPVLAFQDAIALGRDGSLAPFAAPGPLPTTLAPYYVAQQLPGAGGIVATPAVGQDGTLYVSAGRSVRALAPGGALLWEQALTGGSTASSPALVCDGTLYVGDSLGNLVALATDSAGLAPGGWPRFRHDEGNTGNASTPVCSQ